MLVLSLLVSLLFNRFSWAIEFTQEGLRETNNILNLQGYPHYYSDAQNYIFPGQENILQPGQYQSNFQYNTVAQNQPVITSYSEPVLSSTARNEAQTFNEMLHIPFDQHLGEPKFYDGYHPVVDSHPEHSADHQFYQYQGGHVDQPGISQFQSNDHLYQNQHNLKEHMEKENFEFWKKLLDWNEAPLDEPFSKDSSFKAATPTRKVANPGQEECFMNNVVKECDFGHPSQSAINSEKSILSNYFLPKADLQHSTESKNLPLSWNQEPEIHNLRELVNHENLNAAKLGISNFHETLLINRPKDSNNHDNSLISNHLPPQRDKKNIFNSNYLLRYPPNQIENSNKGNLENFNIKGYELDEQRLRYGKVDNMNSRFQTETTLEPEKSSDSLRSHLGVNSHESFTGHDEDDLPKVIISDSNLDSNSPPLLSNVGDKLFNNLNGIEITDYSKSKKSKDNTNLKRAKAARNKPKNLGDGCKLGFNSNTLEEVAIKTNDKSRAQVIKDDFNEKEALEEISLWENNIFKIKREMEKSKNKLVIAEKNDNNISKPLPGNFIPENKRSNQFFTGSNQKIPKLSNSEEEIDVTKGFMNLIRQNNVLLDINFLKKIIEKTKDIQGPSTKSTFLKFLGTIRQQLENMGTCEFYIPMKDISEFFHNRIAINTKFEQLVDLRENNYNDRITTKLPKQILQKIEADSKESPVYASNKGNKERYLDYLTKKIIITIEIRDSFISLSNIINKVFGNSREEIMENFQENQKRAIIFFDKIFSRVDFRTQHTKIYQAKNGKRTSIQPDLSIEMLNHLGVNNKLPRKSEVELEDKIAIEEAKLVEGVSMFYSINKYSTSFKKAIISKILIKWLTIHHPQILINLKIKVERNQESHTILLFCRRLLYIFKALDVLEKE
ncbi:expressed protein [Phakopsora pachyrhizi]|uniref:Expressed protein n=1 Tax=Phakopsora pachyrhizi TaxID=170000 RepID=A0AAV0BTX0_PHAPC|nr:expressed protein [Phakopsora pachyrhizi]